MLVVEQESNSKELCWGRYSSSRDPCEESSSVPQRRTAVKGELLHPLTICYILHIDRMRFVKTAVPLLHNHFEEELDDLFRGHDGEKQGGHREKRSDSQLNRCARTDREQVHAINERITIAEIRQRLDISRA
jgi:hypothetical protein